MHLLAVMHTILTILGCALAGGLAGFGFSAAAGRLFPPRPRRHRGAHRPAWRRGPRTDPFRSTDAPLSLGLTHDAVTQKIPLLRDGDSLGEQ
jgi:hypothetical protein